MGDRDRSRRDRGRDRDRSRRDRDRRRERDKSLSADRSRRDGPYRPQRNRKRGEQGLIWDGFKWHAPKDSKENEKLKEEHERMIRKSLKKPPAEEEKKAEPKPLIPESPEMKDTGSLAQQAIMSQL